MDGLAKAAGHQDRQEPLKDYCKGLLLPGERKMIFVGFINHGNAEAGQKALDAAVDWVYQTQSQLPSTAPQHETIKAN